MKTPSTDKAATARQPRISGRGRIVAAAVAAMLALAPLWAAPIDVSLTTADGAGADAQVVGYGGGPTGPDRSGENFGGLATLSTRFNTLAGSLRNEKSYFRFDLPDGIATVTAATIQLYATRIDGAGNGHVIELYGLLEAADYGSGRLGEEWGETALTWANAPGNVAGIGDNNLNGAYTVLLATFPYPGAAGTISLSNPAILAFLNADSNALATFILRTTTQESVGGGGVQKLFASKETLVPSAHAPRLLLTYVAIPEPASFVLLAVAGLAVGRRRKLPR